MPGDKSDPLQQSGPQRKVTMWIDREGMQEARENYWQAIKDQIQLTNPEGEDRRTWDIAFAAAVAAIDFVMAGRVTP